MTVTEPHGLELVREATPSARAPSCAHGSALTPSRALEPLLADHGVRDASWSAFAMMGLTEADHARLELAKLP
jgi:hypothetical protein